LLSFYAPGSEVPVGQKNNIVVVTFILSTIIYLVTEFWVKLARRLQCMET